METMTSTPEVDAKKRDLLLSILREPYAWPGGYERFLVLEDGALLCPKCCRENGRCIMDAIRDGYNGGWLPIGTTYEAVAPDCVPNECEDETISYCAHCHKPIGELGA